MSTTKSLTSRKYCKYCKKITHNIDYCPKIRCKKCHKKGHPHWKCEKKSIPYEIIVEIVKNFRPNNFRELLHLTIKFNVYENFKSLFDYVDQHNYNNIYEVFRKIKDKGDLYNLKKMNNFFEVDFYPVPCNGGNLIHICEGAYTLPLSKILPDKIVVEYELGRYGEFKAYVEYPLSYSLKKSNIMDFYYENISIQEFNYIKENGITNMWEYFRDFIYDESSLPVEDWTHKMKLRFLDTKSINYDDKNDRKLIDKLFRKNVDLKDYPFQDNKPLFDRCEIMGSKVFLDRIRRCNNGKLYILEIGT